MGPTDPARMDQMIASSPLYARYAQPIDRDSAHEMLARKLEQGAQTAQAQQGGYSYQQPGQGAVQDSWGEAPRQQPRRRAEKAVLQKVADSSAFKQFARSAGREIVRSIFGAGRRR